MKPREAVGTDNQLKKSLATLHKSITKRGTGDAVQLPLWPDAKRGTPNSFIRSALFSAIQGKDRQFIDGRLLDSQAGITIKYTGQQLNQEDLSLWETLVEMTKANPLGNVVSFSAHSILKSLELNTGGDEHARLHKGITRLNACSVEITHDGKTYFGALIKSGVKDELTSHYTVELNRELIRLYGETLWTAIDWPQRLALRRKPLAQSLHAYFSSHRVPFPVKLTTLQRLSGCKNIQASSFKRQCRTALDQLVRIDFLTGYQIDGDMVTVKRLPALPSN
jgi:hypothetical protein